MRISKHIVFDVSCAVLSLSSLLEEFGFNFILMLFSLAATRSPDSLHSQTKTFPSKTFSEDDQVHPCHHPH